MGRRQRRATHWMDAAVVPALFLTTAKQDMVRYRVVDAIRHSGISAAHWYYLHFSARTVALRTVEAGARTEKICALPIGPESLVQKYFKTPIPTEAEVEYAINAIEDALMGVAWHKPQNARLITCNRSLARVLKISATAAAQTYSTQAVEEVFNHYALLSMGRSPAIEKLEPDPLAFATLLVVREILHHLGYPGITVMQGDALPCSA